MKVKSGRLACIPYTLGKNDVIGYYVNLVSQRRCADTLKRQFDWFDPEAAGSGTVMRILLHPG